MGKNFAKNKKSFDGHATSRRLLIMMTMTVAGLLAMAAFFISSRHHSFFSVSAMHAGFLKIKNRMVLHSVSLKKEAKETRKKIIQGSVDKKTDEQSIHFEFYDTLPGMQVTVPMGPATPITVPRMASIQTPKRIQPFIDPDELERDVSLQIKKNKRILTR